MLYLTTRDRYDTYTAARTLAGDTAPNGGRYLPYKMPVFDFAQIKGRSFGENVADVLNRFFSTRLTGHDVEFAVGRYPLKCANVGKHVTVAELWRNLDGSYEKMERRLASSIGAKDGNITSWMRIAIRIAVLTGVFAELSLAESETVDVALPMGDFSVNMAVWYGREMGLPIHNIICCSQQGSVVWDLLHLGQMRDRGADSATAELERLIYGTLGLQEALRYSQACASGKEYALLPADTEKLRKGMFAAVVSDDRVESTVANVFSTNGYLLETEAAGAYSALMDYRARTGENRTALLLGDRAPKQGM